MGLNREDDHNTRIPDDLHPSSGLDKDACRREVMKILNHALSNEAVLAQKTRSAHWNVSGPGFIKRHVLYDDQYQQLNAISDKIALRARLQGGLSVGSFEEFLYHTRLEDQPGKVPGMVDLLSDHESAVRFLQDDVKKCSLEYGDEGTGEFLAAIQTQHENMAFTLRSYLFPDMTPEER
jgi:starvation-inducible DNA-binding protein